MSLLSSKTRGRPRPRVRRRTQTGGEMELDNKNGALGVSKSDQSVYGREQGQRGGNVGKGRR